MRQWQNMTQLKTIEMSLDEIITKNYQCANCSTQEDRILVDVNGELIFGMAQIEKLISEGKVKTLVTVLDLEALWLRMRTLEDMGIDCSIPERVAIGLSLKRFVGSNQGVRNDLNPQQEKKYLKNDKNNGQLVFLGTQVNKKVDGEIAEIVGLSSRSTYLRAKQVCLNGVPELISTMNSKQIDIKNAAEISESPKEQQYELLNIWKLNNKRKRAVS